MKLKYTGKNSHEITLTQEQIKEYLNFERNQEIQDWYPTVPLIPNSRISAREGMTVADLFTKRELACHARLFSLILHYSSGAEQQLLLMAFTANLANCSILVPPISSRGEMSQGAWMTGFYTGKTYIENNVLHYFENRLEKVIKGKEDFLSKTVTGLFDPLHGKEPEYRISHLDAKHLDDIADESIDYIFTDPPYGDTVPYFEQSIIWNAWLGIKPDYNNEIVISNSNVRNKDIAHFEKDIFDSFQEIHRVLKSGKYFSLTYHSLSGKEWKAITNACIHNGFKMVDYQWLTQKTFTPRQLNRTQTVKGDVLITFRKEKRKIPFHNYDDPTLQLIIIDHIRRLIETTPMDTNHILMMLTKWIFTERIILGNIDIYEILKDHFTINEQGLWQKLKAA